MTCACGSKPQTFPREIVVRDTACAFHGDRELDATARRWVAAVKRVLEANLPVIDVRDRESARV